MGMRWQIDEDQDIKLSGLLAEVVIKLGYANVSERGFITDNVVTLSTDQVNKVISVMSEELYCNGRYSQFDELKFRAIVDWHMAVALDKTLDEDSITFS